MKNDDEIREQLLRALGGRSEYAEVLEALRDVPPEARGRKVAG